MRKVRRYSCYLEWSVWMVGVAFDPEYEDCWYACLGPIILTSWKETVYE